MKFLTQIMLILSLFLGTINAQDLSGKDVMRLVDDRNDGDDKKSQTTMTLINKNGKKRVRSMLAYSKDYGKDSKGIFYFQKPADVKGTGFLTWSYDDVSKDDDRWLYLPALKKSRRISGSSKNNYFMGSDLTYDDMGGRSVDEDVHTLIGEESIDNKPCFVVESVPKKSDEMYSKIVSYVDKGSYIVIKAQFFDRQKKLLKVLKVLEIKDIQKIPTVTKMQVQNVQTSHKTIMQTSDVKYNLGLKDSLFRVSTLERGHIR